MVGRISLIGLTIALALQGGVAPRFAQAGEITVFAAASLKNALDELAALYTQETGHRVTVSLAGSSALARQIEYGAPADIYFSASAQWMDYLEERGLIASATRLDLLGNRIVLVAPSGSAPGTGPVDAEDVLQLLGDGRLAMALVDAVPAGQYGKAALQEMGVWQQLRPSVAEVDNVRAALALVALGEAPLGVVYATDAGASENVEIVGVFPDEVAPEIVYPVARLAKGDGPLSKAFLDFMQSGPARDVFETQGFAFLKDAGS